MSFGKYPNSFDVMSQIIRAEMGIALEKSNSKKEYRSPEKLFSEVQQHFTSNNFKVEKINGVYILSWE